MIVRPLFHAGIVGTLVVPALALAQGLAVQPPANPNEGWGMVVAVLASALLGGGAIIWMVAKRHLKALDNLEAEQKNNLIAIRDVAESIRAHREEAVMRAKLAEEQAAARALLAEEQSTNRHAEIVNKISGLETMISLKDSIARIEAATAGASLAARQPSSPDQPPPTVRGARQRAG